MPKPRVVSFSDAGSTNFLMPPRTTTPLPARTPGRGTSCKSRGSASAARGVSGASREPRLKCRGMVRSFIITSRPIRTWSSSLKQRMRIAMRGSVGCRWGVRCSVSVRNCTESTFWRPRLNAPLLKSRYTRRSSCSGSENAPLTPCISDDILMQGPVRIRPRTSRTQPWSCSDASLASTPPGALGMLSTAGPCTLTSTSVPAKRTLLSSIASPRPRPFRKPSSCAGQMPLATCRCTSGPMSG
mmetsp:Transcript_33068/g.104642  ORF Transcript_33068/g.104642 Transcript_33068/m.104642 type:complete len:242 (-) Transcript_33068:2555-3280(-)